MISLLFSNWRFVVDALLIIALVVLVFVVNPFGIFGNGLSVGATTNMVTEVNQIGQLVTAEYYGEVISSLDESRLLLIEEDSTQEQANQYYSEIKHARFDLYQYQQIPRKERTEEYRNRDEGEKSVEGNWRRVIQHKVSRRNILEKIKYHGLFDTDLAEQTSADKDECTTLLCQIAEFLWREKYGHNEKDKWNPNERTIEEVLFTIYNEVEENSLRSSDEAFQRYLDDGFDFPADFQSFVFNEQKTALTRTERKKKLTLVGRGWVKAGFNFQNLDENSYYFHEESGELHFFGLEPQILNADINPWFIPQRGIPGFEVIDYRGKVNFKDAQWVKQHCIDKLLSYAHQANILEQAQQQGGETLKSFFSLLTGEEVTKVHFHNDLLTQTFKEVGRDEFISYYEGVLIDSLLRRERWITDSIRNTKTNWTRNQQLANERDTLQKKALARLLGLPFEGSDKLFNYYSVLGFRVIQDSIIDQYEQQELQAARWKVGVSDNHQRMENYKHPQFWYYDTLTLMSQYNTMLAQIEESNANVGSVKTDYFTTNSDSISAIIQDSLLKIIDYYELEDSIFIRYWDTSQAGDEQWLANQYFPFRYTDGLFEKFTQTDSLLEVSTLDSSTLMLTRIKPDKFWIYNMPSNQLMTINLPIDSLILFDENPLINLVFKDSTLLFISTSSYSLNTNNILYDSIYSMHPEGELSFYFNQLEKSYQHQEKKGPIVRASEWFWQQLGQRTDSLKRVTQIQNYFASFDW